MSLRPSRAASVEPKLDEMRPDLRRKENRWLLPQPPEGLTDDQRRVWRNEQLQKLVFQTLELPTHTIETITAPEDE